MIAIFNLIIYPTANEPQSTDFIIITFCYYSNKLPLIHNAPNTTISPVPINLDRLTKPAWLKRPGEHTYQQVIMLNIFFLQN